MLQKHTPHSYGPFSNRIRLRRLVTTQSRNLDAITNQFTVNLILMYLAKYLVKSASMIGMDPCGLGPDAEKLAAGEDLEKATSRKILTFAY
jgi:hypothetical protein